MSDSGPRKRRVLIVDDHPIVRQGLAQLLAHDNDLEICGEAGDIAQARNAIATTAPDVMILDLHLRDGDGLEVLRDLRRQGASLPVLVLSMYDEDVYAERLLSEGANGYVMKQAAADQLLGAVRRVLDGNVYVSSQVALGLVDRLTARARHAEADPVARLSNRELQIVNLIGQGRSTREISLSLSRSVKTVEAHRQRIKRKLDLTTPQLVQFAMKWCAQRH